MCYQKQNQRSNGLQRSHCTQDRSGLKAVSHYLAVGSPVMWFVIPIAFHFCCTGTYAAGSTPVDYPSPILVKMGPRERSSLRGDEEAKGVASEFIHGRCKYEVGRVWALERTTMRNA